MLDYIFSVFPSPVFVSAIVVGCLVSLCSALLGVSLVLKRYSMIGDGLSHVGFGAMSVAAVLNLAPLWVAVPVMILTAFLLLRLSENSKLKGDSVIALISSSAVAVGLIAAHISGTNRAVDSYLFGSIVAVGKNDMYVSIALSAVVLALYLIFYNRIFAVTFDESSARANGVRAGAYNVLIALLSAITIVVGMRLMGTLLISGLIVFPAISSMRVFKSYRGVVISSAIISVLCFLAGFILACFDLPTGASIVIADLAVFLVFSLVGFLRKKVEKK